MESTIYGLWFRVVFGQSLSGLAVIPDHQAAGRAHGGRTIGLLASPKHYLVVKHADARAASCAVLPAGFITFAHALFATTVFSSQQYMYIEIDIYIRGSLPKKRPQYRLINTVVLIMGTPEMVPLILGNAHVY